MGSLMIKKKKKIFRFIENRISPSLLEIEIK